MTRWGKPFVLSGPRVPLLYYRLSLSFYGWLCSRSYWMVHDPVRGEAWLVSWGGAVSGTLGAIVCLISSFRLGHRPTLLLSLQLGHTLSGVVLPHRWRTWPRSWHVAAICAHTSGHTSRTSHFYLGAYHRDLYLPGLHFRTFVSHKQHVRAPFGVLHLKVAQQTLDANVQW